MLNYKDKKLYINALKVMVVKNGKRISSRQLLA